MERFGFRASSPAAAMESKPTKPKKQRAAPAITPATPNGRKPPRPASPVIPSKLQLDVEAVHTSCQQILHYNSPNLILEFLMNRLP